MSREEFKRVTGSGGRHHGFVVIFVTVVAASFSTSAGLGQARSALSSRSSVLNGPDLPPFDPAESLGVFVGVEKFPEDEAITEADFAVDDAVDLAHLFSFELSLIPPDRMYIAISGSPQKPAARSRLKELQRSGAQLVEPTRTRLLALSRTMTREAGAKGLLLMSISSHGFDDDGEHLILTQDSLMAEIRDTALPVRKFFQAASQAPSRRRLLLIDACRTRLLRDRRLAVATKISSALRKALSKSHGQAVLAAARPGEAAYAAGGNGIFMGAVLEGLRCRASRDSRGFVTVETLSNFVDMTVTEWNRRRHLGSETDLGIDRLLGGPVGRLPLVRCKSEKPPVAFPESGFASGTERRDLAPSSCQGLSLDLDAGTLSGLKPMDGRDQILQRLPCDPLQIPDSAHELAGLIYPLHGVHFATDQKIIKAQATFSGKVIFAGRRVLLLGQDLSSAFELLGQPRFERRDAFFWERPFGCLELALGAGRITEIRIHGTSCPDPTRL